MKKINTIKFSCNSKKLCLIIILCLIFLSTAELFAQTSGKLVGRVTDQNGEPMIGANIILDGTTMGAATDIEGYYSIINIRAGVYKVKFRFLGYKAQVVENIRISADQTTNLDASLQLEVIEGEEVVIVAK